MIKIKQISKLILINFRGPVTNTNIAQKMHLFIEFVRKNQHFRNPFFDSYFSNDCTK